MKRIIRDRHLTPQEAAEYNTVRDKIEQEKPEINARIRSHMATGRLPAGEDTTVIREHDKVVLTMDLPEYDLRTGDVGVVVVVRGDHGYEVEFVALDGQPVAIVSLSVAQVRPIRPGEIAHVRPIEAA